ncbi:MAG: helix-turn-helix transcriptional regulator [Coriobacteriia bacterium]|nr:helix-turn-helix transcriptional regulator [Coriobacteriia bacterium]
MTQTNMLLQSTPYAVEQALIQLGAGLRTARVRRGITMQQAAERIGTGVRSVRDAERGKVSTAAAVYLSLLWSYGLLEQIQDAGNPLMDIEGLRLMTLREPKRAQLANPNELDNDF